MRLSALSLPCVVVAVTLLSWSHSGLSQKGPRPRLAPVAGYDQLPLSFEANQGQADPRARFTSHGFGYTLSLTSEEAVLSLGNSTPTGPASREAIHMQLVGANPAPSVSGEDRLTAKINYFLGNDPSKWLLDIPVYSKVRYSTVYPGVDLLYYGNQRQLEYDFVVAAGADPKPVQLHFAGTNKLRLAQSGDLTVTGKKGDLVFHKPVVYQLRCGKRERVAGRFRLLAGNNVGFAIGNYDRTKELIIDPVLTYSTYLGGTSGALIRAMAVDSSGNAYLTGEVYGGLPTTAGVYQSAPKNTAKIYTSAFVTKLNAAGTALLYETYLGGSGGFDSATGSDGGDTAYALAVDSSGNAFIAGQTDSADFPTSASAFQKSNKGVPNQVTNGFVTKLNSTGSALLYSTFLGGAGVNGNGGDSISGIAVDAAGNAYLSGGTYSSNFPLAGTSFQKANKAAALLESNAFVAKLNSTGSALVYSTYLGGTGNGSVNSPGGGDAAGGIAIDAAGDAYVSGATGSSDFPITSGAFQNSNKAFANAETNGFVTEINPAGSALLYSTYLGGSGLASQAGNGSGDVVNSVALASSGDIYVSGDTISTNFPVSSTALQNKNASSPTLAIGCGFVARINPTNKALVYSTYLCGTAGDLIFAPIAVDSAGNAYVAGQAFSANFPVTKNAYQGTNNASKLGTYNAFLTELNATMTGLVYSSYFGGHGYQSCVAGNCASFGDFAYGLAIDKSGDAYLAGWSFSPDFPITKGAYQTSHTPSLSSYVAKFDLASSGAAVATSTSLTSDAATQTAGVKVTFTAYVQHTSGTVVPTGTVSFTVDSGSPIVVSLDSTAHAAYAISTLSVGTHSIKATYSGNSTYLASSSPALTETITAPPAATPVFTPAAGTYHTTQSVKITDSTAGATLYYTINGSTPTTSSTRYTGPIAVSATETIKAIADETGYSASAVNAATFTIVPAATPSFSPGAGTYTAAQSVKIADATAGATIYYTTNGSTPTTSSTKYIAAITVSSTETIKAIAVATGYNNSAVASAIYTIEVPAALPTFAPLPAVYITAQSVKIADTTPGAILYYTLNGATPTTASTKYTAAIPITATTTVKAIAVATGYLTSPVASATFVINPNAGIISTIAGTGGASDSGNGGPALKATLNVPFAAIYDSKGDLIVSDFISSTIRRITPAGIISTIAGTGVLGSGGDGGPAVSAQLWHPQGMAFDAAGNLYIADGHNCRIRKITPAGIISTFAGNGAAGSLGDAGPATAAELKYPGGVAFDAGGNLYIADWGNNRVRKVTPAGIISTSAGTGVQGYLGDGGKATAAKLYEPQDVAFDAAGNQYIADQGNNVVRKVTTAGIISTVAGNGKAGYLGDGGKATAAELNAPQNLALDSLGNLFIADNGNNVLRHVTASGIISTIAGKGTAAFLGDGGPAPDAELYVPGGMAFDSRANLYFADSGNNRVRKITYPAAAAPLISPAPGTYTTAQTVTLSDASPGALVYYTTNGTMPSPASTRYTAPFKISTSQTIKVIAVDTGFSNSPVSSATYTIP